MKIGVYLTYLFVLVINKTVDTANILAVFPSASKSHWIFSQPLLHELIKSGHRITIISPYPLKNPPQNYRDIPTPERKYIYNERTPLFISNIDSFPLKKIKRMSYDGYSVTNFTLRHPNVQNLLKSNETFELIILDVFLNEAMIGFGHYYKAPTIGISAMGPTSWIGDMLGTPLPLSYVPNSALDLTEKMSYSDRLWNCIITMGEYILRETYILKLQEKLYEDIFPNPKPTFGYAVKNTLSLGLINSHFTSNFPQPFLPNSIEVGGMQIKTEVNPLPIDIKEFIDSANQGVIYFALGSNLLPTKIPRGKLDHIFNALIKLKQKVLWKWDAPELFKQHENILIREWFPQDDILVHKNVKIFITHGGLLSYTEAIYHGIPFVGIPIFGDQKMNVARGVQNGIGILVDYDNVTEESITWAVNEILSNKRYQINAKIASNRFRDQPETPLQRAKFWVEYVLRHNGAPQLKSASQGLSSLAYNMLDVWAILALGMLLLFVLIVFGIRFLLSIICKIVKTNVVKKNN